MSGLLLPAHVAKQLAAERPNILGDYIRVVYARKWELPARRSA